MAQTEQIVFQPYVTGKRGAIMPGPAIPCRSIEEANRRAEKAMAGGQVLGGHVVRMMVDAEAGDYGDPEFVATYGTVPEAN
jgi:hypothetical protein